MFKTSIKILQYAFLEVSRDFELSLRTFKSVSGKNIKTLKSLETPMNVSRTTCNSLKRSSRVTGLQALNDSDSRFKGYRILKIQMRLSDSRI